MLRAGSNRLVVGFSQFPCVPDLTVVFLVELFFVLDMDLRLMAVVVPGADERIQRNEKRQQESQHSNGYYQNPFLCGHCVLLSALAPEELRGEEKLD